MIRMLTTCLALGILAGTVGGQEDKDLEKVAELQKKLHEVVDKVTPAFVFVGGGSGFCISEDGWILTNCHVAGTTGKKWKVRFAGGKEHDAEVIGFDPLGDISLMKIDGVKGLPVMELGDSDALKVGQYVMAVGNPFRLGNESWEPTVTLGVVSALHRYQDWYMDAIQTDAQINPGNSGGPLVTMEGKVVGINGRIDIQRFRTRVNSGIGYSIPSNQIRRYLRHLRLGGRVRHGFIEGITAGECGDDRYENVGEYGDGVFVAGLVPDTPADAAGFDRGDIIHEVGGQRVINLNRVHGILGTYPPGEVVPVRFRRWEGKDKGWVEKETRVFLGDPGTL
ncbi:MAG: S1C family serine protease, partial [Planctomycetota bacterium]